MRPDCQVGMKEYEKDVVYLYYFFTKPLTTSVTCAKMVTSINEDRGALHEKYRGSRLPKSRAEKAWVPKRALPLAEVYAGSSDNICSAVAEMRRAITLEYYAVRALFCILSR